MDSKTGEKLAALRDEIDRIKANHVPSRMASRSGRPDKDRFHSLGKQVMTDEAEAVSKPLSDELDGTTMTEYRRIAPFSPNLFIHLLAVTHTDPSGDTTLTAVGAELRREHEPPNAEPVVAENLTVDDLAYPSDPLLTWKKLVDLEESFMHADAYGLATSILAPESEAERPHPI